LTQLRAHGKRLTGITLVPAFFEFTILKVVDIENSQWHILVGIEDSCGEGLQ
jgi:hypothetical protein